MSVVKDQMKYDKATLTLPPGRKIKLNTSRKKGSNSIMLHLF